MPSQIEMWCHMWGTTPHEYAEDARKLEADGWYGGIIVDSHCFAQECWTILAICAERTSKLMLTTGATNPVSRHPSVTASAVATLQQITNGRMGLGIARGDSALATIGAAPMEIDKFEDYLALIQDYLSGNMVPLDKVGYMVPDSRHDFDKLAMGKPLPGSALFWLQKLDLPKVPLEVMVTGPKAIKAAARTAEWVILNVGADIERTKWAIDVTREAAREAGREPRIGLYLTAVPHDDPEESLRLGKPMAGSFGRFSVMNKQVVGPVTDSQRRVLENIAKHYDYSAHGSFGEQTDVMTPDFVEQFIVTGTTSQCIDRLQALIGLDGVERVNFMPSKELADPAGLRSRVLLSSVVLPELTR